MSSPKTRNQRSFYIALEATYRNKVASTVSVLTTDFLGLVPKYHNAGERKARSQNTQTLKKVRKTGRYVEFSPSCEMIAGGSAYSASVRPMVHELMRAAGYDSALVTTGGAEKYTYTPWSGSGTPASYCGDVYENGHLYGFAGGYADMNVSAEVGDLPVMEFPTMAVLASDVSENAVAAAYNTVMSPLKSEEMDLTIGTFAPVVVKEFSFALGRSITSRGMDQTSANHGGFCPGAINPTIEFVFEMTALASAPYHGVSTLNPYKLDEEATELALAFDIGKAQYNRCKFAATKAQVLEMEEVEDGPISLWRVKFQLAPSNPTVTDSHSWIWD